MKTLKDLYNGNIFPSERNPPMMGEERHPLRQQIIQYEKELLDLLPEEKQNLLDQWQDTQNQLTGLYEESRFCEGFCLGAKIILEILLEQ